jgi:hypothetical protein
VYIQAVGILLVLAGACVSVDAQWINYPTPGTPRTRDGKPNLTAKAPRAANGKPDLSGVWQVEPTPAAEMKRLFGDLSADSALGDTTAAFSKYLINILLDFKPEETPVKPEFADIVRQRSKQAYENTFRRIYTDGRKPPADPEPLWLGHSVGKWEDDTMVVDTVGFNDKSWLDGFGHPHSEALHMTERFHRLDFGHLDIEVTIDDPKVYTRSFSIKFTELLVPDSDVTEYFCNENEKDQPHIGGK